MSVQNPPTYIKDPGAVLDYEVDWGTNWLVGDTITASTWTVPTGITKASDSHTTTTTVIWLADGAAGTSYEITNHITTAAGRVDDRTIRIQCRDR